MHVEMKRRNAINLSHCATNLRIVTTDVYTPSDGIDSERPPPARETRRGNRMNDGGVSWNVSPHSEPECGTLKMALPALSEQTYISSAYSRPQQHPVCHRTRVVFRAQEWSQWSLIWPLRARRERMFSSTRQEGSTISVSTHFHPSTKSCAAFSCRRCRRRQSRCRRRSRCRSHRCRRGRRERHRHDRCRRRRHRRFPG